MTRRRAEEEGFENLGTFPALEPLIEPAAGEVVQSYDSRCCLLSQALA